MKNAGFSGFLFATLRVCRNGGGETFQKSGAGRKARLFRNRGNFLIRIQKQSVRNIHPRFKKQFFLRNAEMIHKGPVDGGNGEMKCIREVGNLNRSRGSGGQPLNHVAQNRMIDRIASGAHSFNDRFRRSYAQDLLLRISVQHPVKLLRYTQSAFIKPSFHT